MNDAVYLLIGMLFALASRKLSNEPLPILIWFGIVLGWPFMIAGLVILGIVILFDKIQI